MAKTTIFLSYARNDDEPFVKRLFTGHVKETGGISW